MAEAEEVRRPHLNGRSEHLIRTEFRAEPSMATVVTIMNMKGGVGKTTVAMHLAGVVAREDLGSLKPIKVLAIDYDPQFNLSQAYLKARDYFALERARKTVLSVLLDDDSQLDPYKLQVPGSHEPPRVSEIAVPIYQGSSARGRLDIVPSTLDLMYVALGKTSASTKPIEERFAKFIDDARSSYDLILIDCHPAGSIFTHTALANSDHVLIPVIPQTYAVRGIGLMMNFISAKKSGDRSPTPHILFNSVPRFGIEKDEERIRGNRQFADHCLTSTLKWYKAFADPEEGRGFVWFSSKPYSGEAFRNLWAVSREVIHRVGLL